MEEPVAYCWGLSLPSSRQPRRPPSSPTRRTRRQSLYRSSALQLPTKLSGPNSLQWRPIQLSSITPKSRRFSVSIRLTLKPYVSVFPPEDESLEGIWRWGNCIPANLRVLSYRKSDLEAGCRPLYPMMLESPQLRWAFIRKIYSILSFQLILTIAVASVVVSYHPIALFFTTTGGGLALYILLILMPFMVMIPLYYYHQQHPVNYILLVVFTVSLSFVVGLTCAFTSGKIILESAILTAVVVVSLTLYTFWAAKRGHDFNFLGPFLFGALLVLIVFAMIQIFFPLGRISMMVYGCLASIIFCGYIVYDTDNLIKRYSYDEYIWAAVALYLDIINLFLALLTIFRATDS